MRIAIIDADLIGRNNHRFPNLACMKISGYFKSKGDEVELKLDYNNLEEYDKVFISKVFTDTPVNEDVLKMNNVTYGGTGFYYDKAPKLPCYIEHCMPDYDLYLDFVNTNIEQGAKRKDFEYYLDYSIGFTTRGCFRKCEFCVNKNYNKVEKHSPLSEFYNENKKYICLLDDNILGYSGWREVFEELIETGKPFQYKQGMDERILTKEKCEVLAKCKYKGDFLFAFDNINDRQIIETKLKLLRQYVNKRCKFYILCAFDREGKWDNDFWRQDIIDTFERISILVKYNCLPYIMRFKEYENSPYRGLYINLASWCNQPSFFNKTTFREFCIKRGISSKVYKEYKDNPDKYLKDGYKKGSAWRYLDEFSKDNKDIVDMYFDLDFSQTSANESNI